METLHKQKKHLMKHMKSASEEQKSELQGLWRGLKARHSALNRADSARKTRSQKKKNEFARQLLDLANAYGSVPHQMIQLALTMYNVQKVQQVMLDDYFSGFWMVLH